MPSSSLMTASLLLFRACRESVMIGDPLSKSEMERVSVAFFEVVNLY